MFCLGLRAVPLWVSVARAAAQGTISAPCASGVETCLVSGDNVILHDVGLSMLQHRRAMDKLAVSLDSSDLPPLVTFDFTAMAGSDLAFLASGTSASLDSRVVAECNDNVGQEHAVGDMAFVTMRYNGGNCYADSRYSNTDYLVEAGSVAGMAAYRVQPAQTKATSFVASGTGMYVRFSEQKDHSIYVLEAGSLVKVGGVLAAEVEAGGYVKTSVTVHDITEATTFVIAAADADVPQPASRLMSGATATECDMSNVESASLGDLALVTMKYNGGSCWTDGRYNNGYFLVERGSLTGTDGVLLSAPESRTRVW